MKTLEELQAFCEGYLVCYFNNIDMDIGDVDDWIVWDAYDINLTGCAHAEVDDDELSINVYPKGWKDNLPDPLFSFTINQRGESK
jgi:hypothetical protein